MISTARQLPSAFLGPELRQLELAHVQRAMQHVHSETVRGIKSASAALGAVRRVAPSPEFVTPEIEMTLTSMDAQVVDAMLYMTHVERELAAQRKQLEDEMRKQRFDTFKQHYRPSVDAEEVAHTTCELFSCEVPSAHRMHCCARSICTPCLTQVSFFGTDGGTAVHAPCPFCRGPFCVYDDASDG